MNQRRRFPEQPTVIAGCFVWQSYFKHSREHLLDISARWLKARCQPVVFSMRRKWKGRLISMSPTLPDSRTEDDRQYHMKIWIGTDWSEILENTTL
jgi:hypothetical protein